MDTQKEEIYYKKYLKYKEKYLKLRNQMEGGFFRISKKYCIFIKHGESCTNIVPGATFNIIYKRFGFTHFLTVINGQSIPQYHYTGSFEKAYEKFKKNKNYNTYDKYICLEINYKNYSSNNYDYINIYDDITINTHRKITGKSFTQNQICK